MVLEAQDERVRCGDKGVVSHALHDLFELDRRAERAAMCDLGLAVRAVPDINLNTPEEKKKWKGDDGVVSGVCGVV